MHLLRATDRRGPHRADAANRPVGADEVVTACQAACPTQAFTFGNMAEGGDVAERKQSPLTTRCWPTRTPIRA